MGQKKTPGGKRILPYTIFVPPNTHYPTAKQYGELIERLREKHGLDNDAGLAKLAAFIEISAQSLHTMELGGLTPDYRPRLKALERICEFFDMTLAAFVDEASKVKPRARKVGRPRTKDPSV